MLYLIADTHFDHTNIISYCNRPFSSIEEMTNTIIWNWNNTVKPEDTVLHLGDIRFGRESKEAQYYLDKLQDNIIVLKGSHDHDPEHKFMPFSYYISRGHYKFIAIHDKDDKPYNFHGWTIHGHSHDVPSLVDIFHNRVCVSVENIDYTPISMDRIINLIEIERHKGRTVKEWLRAS